MDLSYDAILFDIIIDDVVVMLMYIKLCYTLPFEAFHQHILSGHMVLIHHGLFQHEYIYSFHTGNLSTQCDLYPVSSSQLLMDLVMQYNTHYTDFLGVPLSAHLLCSSYIVTEEPVQQSSLIACYHRIMPNIKCDHFLALFPIHLEQLFPPLLRMLKPDNQPSTLKKFEFWMVCFGFKWMVLTTNSDHFSSIFQHLVLLVSLLKVFRLMIQTMLSPIFQS